MVPLNASVNKWIQDLNQGMKNFKPIGDASEHEKDNLRMINPKKAFES